MRPLRLLLIEDSEDDALLISRRLQKAGYNISSLRVENREDMARALNEKPWDLALCDHSMPNFSHTAALETIARSGLDIPLVIVSGAIDEKTAVQAMKAGARDYVMKDSLSRLVPVIERELLSRQLREDKQKAELELATQLHLHKELIETIPAAVTRKNREGVYLGCNKRFARWIGKRNAEEVIGHTVFDFMPPEMAALHNKKDDELLISGGHIKYEASMEDSEGKKRHLVVHKAAYTDAQGTPLGLVGVLVDITHIKEAEEARKELEAQLRQAQKLEAIGTLAGGIAHDFNNILAAIVGYSEIAKDQAQSTGQSKTAEFLDHVLQASERAKGLVKQILTFSRKTDQEVQPVNFGLVAKEALKLLRSSLPPSIDMELSIDTNVGLVSADPTSIHQIIMNLCTNAAHAMTPKGGRLKVELHQVEKQVDELTNERLMNPGSYLQLVVSDTGHGMTGSTIERIFDPYFTTKEAGEGTGLGLSVVHGIVTGMGGAIDVKSELGLGTVFTILIPVVNEQLEAPESNPAVSTWGSESILLVDDENSITYILSTQLRQMGYQVTTFNTGDQAWEEFSQNPDQFDAVITDLLMPGLPGDELAERIKGMNPNIPIVVYTGYGECLTKEGKSPKKADALCFKPMHGADIAHVLRGLLDEHSS